MKDEPFQRFWLARDHEKPLKTVLRSFSRSSITGLKATV